ncbi:hypothetical protein LTR91_021028 [Friedmanniomyces endolithicus]|uniref:Uncharacterized protein n=1 Tax=Friedmanniomyces endolithicus TaxID=329885 RepID=A0AAN6HAZ4_9PEZI|nr:hypothetical protein LTR94_015387 [Friedmanniomyces endolithicus]KAK0775469.1 hypothetical protein LTR38_015841 [Friedmanniomyces endolithicus]KAK0777345.1 hypothetical protein LTR59_013887 [Friedmanniomyces endolithicus]KAK0778226.1 hypothetical protein LTR75_015715 [Friedmanniomyces endolithicus]KAK0830163.1 hypothetical protein LTR03_015948 [Friedmanniomyces endolithicus]
MEGKQTPERPSDGRRTPAASFLHSPSRELKWRDRFEETTRLDVEGYRGLTSDGDDDFVIGWWACGDQA